MDLTGLHLGMWNNTNTKVMQDGIEIMREHYPDVYGKTTIINAPWFARGIWAVVKGWLS